MTYNIDGRTVHEYREDDEEYNWVLFRYKLLKKHADAVSGCLATNVAYEFWKILAVCISFGLMSEFGDFHLFVSWTAMFVWSALFALIASILFLVGACIIAVVTDPEDL